MCRFVGRDVFMLWSGRRRPVVAQAVVAVGLAWLGGVAFLRLGFGPWGAVGLIVCAAIGGFVDIPLFRMASDPTRVRLGMNLGGAMLPLVLVGHQATKLPGSSWWPAAGAIFAVAAISFATARPVVDRGVFVPWLLPGMLAAALALVLAPSSAPGLAFVAAVAGSFLGADLMTLSAIARLGAAKAVLGGSGPFDGLLWTGLLATLLSGTSS